MADKWIESLKVGDKALIYRYGYGNTLYTLGKVERRTKTIVVVNGTRFNMSGRVVGADSWSRVSLEEFKEEVWQEAQQKQQDRDMRNTLNSFAWQRCDIELVRKVHALIVPSPADTSSISADASARKEEK